MGEADRSSLPFGHSILDKKGGSEMLGKSIVLLAALGLVVGLSHCAKGGDAKAPGQENAARYLVPSRTEVKSRSFTVELTDLKVTMAASPSSKETPHLRGKYKITNTSDDVVDLQGATVEYMDQSGNPIGFGSGEKIVKALPFAQTLQPGEASDKALDLTIPRAAIAELAKINIHLVYAPAVLKRETLTLSERIE